MSKNVNSKYTQFCAYRKGAMLIYRCFEEDTEKPFSAPGEGLTTLAGSNWLFLNYQFYGRRVFTRLNPAEVDTAAEAFGVEVHFVNAR